MELDEKKETVEQKNNLNKEKPPGLVSHNPETKENNEEISPSDRNGTSKNEITTDSHKDDSEQQPTTQGGEYPQDSDSGNAEDGEELDSHDEDKDDSNENGKSEEKKRAHKQSVSHSEKKRKLA